MIALITVIAAFLLTCTVLVLWECLIALTEAADEQP